MTYIFTTIIVKICRSMVIVHSLQLYIVFVIKKCIDERLLVVTIIAVFSVSTYNFEIY